MRHSTVQQTEQYYIDAGQLPVAEALAALPKFAVSQIHCKDEPNGVSSVVQAS